jgi:xanthine dehydrogenase accessory factor
MELKLVERCRQELNKPGGRPFLQRQVHEPTAGADWSGLICSGEQSIAFYRLTPQDLELVESLLETGTAGVLTADEHGLRYAPADSLAARYRVTQPATDQWTLREDLGHQPVLHILGGGHVGLALASLALAVDFTVKVYDKREALPEPRPAVDWLRVPHYEGLASLLPGGPRTYVVVMSADYQTDMHILRQLVRMDVRYLGLLGGAKKVKRLFSELQQEGVPGAVLQRIHAPIGLPIASKTPAEIAVSILAQLIQVKNA